MAGLPQSVIKRSSEILKQLENDRNSSGAIQKNVAKIGNEREGIQLSFFQLEDPVLLQIRDEIAGLDINSLTPLEALNKLNEIKKSNGNLIYKFPLQTTIYLLIFSITTSSTGLSKEFVFTAAILSSTSNPFNHLPKHRVLPVQMGRSANRSISLFLRLC